MVGVTQVRGMMQGREGWHKAEVIGGKHKVVGNTKQGGYDARKGWHKLGGNTKQGCNISRYLVQHLIQIHAD